jgi:hypothetical protein
VISFMAALWFVPVAAVRVLAYQSGQVDHTRTMLIVAMVAAGCAMIAVNSLVFLSVLMLA